ncbi:hypothetical protein EGI22_17580 [Lacihabitans sp. LS3-19]|nr:hypothetical protein [Lacihabitans sp. LS3-19]
MKKKSEKLIIEEKIELIIFFRNRSSIKTAKRQKENGGDWCFGKYGLFNFPYWYNFNFIRS